MVVAISTELSALIVALAAALPDAEVCGLLYGDAAAITRVEPCRNVADNPGRRFEIDPAALIAAHRAARAGGPGPIGCFHSHPGGSPEPSLRDAADAAPDGYLWLIVAAGEIRAWRAGPNGPVHGRFTPVRLACTPAAAPPQEPQMGRPHECP